MEETDLLITSSSKKPCPKCPCILFFATVDRWLFSSGKSALNPALHNFKLFICEIILL